MPFDAQGMLGLLAVLALIIWVVWIGRRRAKQACAREERPTRDALSSRHDLQRAMEELQVNLMEFGRDVEGRIDTRMKALEKLIADADERIEALKQAGCAAPSQAGPSPAHRLVYDLADQGLDKVEIARRAEMTPGEVELVLGLRRARGE
jgi:hypothetical protein